MDSEKIDELLNKYWNCETSLEEEEQLRTHFRNTSVSGQQAEVAAMFRYFDQEKRKELTDHSFDRSIKRKLRRPEARVRTLVLNSMRIAAGIVVLILAVWLVRMEVRKNTPAAMEDTYDDPRMAFEETKKALMMISRSFGTAQQQASKIDLFNQAQQEIVKEEKSGSTNNENQ